MKSLLCVATLLLTAAPIFGQTILHQTNPNGSGFFYLGTNGSAANEVGELFRLGASGATVTGFDLPSVVNYNNGSTPPSFVNVRFSVTFFSGFQTTWTGTGPEFSNPVETATFDLGPLAAAPVYAFTGSPSVPYFVLPTPIAVPGDLIGMQLTWFEDTGSGLQPSSHLTLAFTSAPNIVGDNGFYRNVEGTNYAYHWVGLGATDSSTSLPQVPGQPGTRANFHMTIYGTVPEPASSLCLLLGLAALIKKRAGAR